MLSTLSNKISIIFYQLISPLFAVTFITDQNNHCEFDIREVEGIGLIRINDLFRNHVYQMLNCNITNGKNLQEILLDFLREKCYITKESKRYKITKDLIHSPINNPNGMLDIEKFIYFFNEKIIND